MEEFEDFDLVFGGQVDLTYDRKTSEKILKNRRLLENVLFFDRLLSALGIPDGSHASAEPKDTQLMNHSIKIISAYIQPGPTRSPRDYC